MDQLAKFYNLLKTEYIWMYNSVIDTKIPHLHM